MNDDGFRTPLARPARRLLALAFCTLLPAALPSPSIAQPWPERPITAVVPLAAGNAIDVVGRIVLDQMSRQLDRPIVVENRVGAGGTIGAATVAKATPDGYTILVHSSSIAIAPSLYSKLPYDTTGDLAAVIPFGIQPSVLVTTPKKGFKTVADLVAAAKEKPGALNYASAGSGSTSHLAALHMLAGAGLEMHHVPYRGPIDAITGLLAGEIDIYFLPLSAALPHLKEGTLTALAVSTSRRVAALPDVPTTLEAGLPDSAYEFWIGLFVPSKTPPGVIERLYREAQTALRLPEIQEKLRTVGMEPMPLDREQFGRRLRAEIDDVGKLVKAAGIPPVN
ncbi:tripartite tricarboxylate transporter substrate binding protein [Bosea sp. (in: a-proteobacteria)]|uniref:Bug family tripartite tricarboxylate transporter substrate binding protein n=1 Tax=Bosea sp. (in: a-proteobacteria) TaxID=1871050 RepID=UPI0025BE7214|nr:tripartite tricarboxylate transporter substrate binding protein [Bosea sp. (in: a-proteobacteria)]MBR3189955.1 tripartite tricarboxylate transporter substrate binding protein [Bosea sp. (in: a-proteobacteria)]